MLPDADTGGGLYLAPSLYDVVNTPGTAAEVDALERVVKRHLGRGPHRWLEPACGTGRYLRLLRGRGHRVCGYDPVDAMLEYAHRGLSRYQGGWQLLPASFTSPGGDLAAVRPADVAICPVNSLRHLPDDRSLQAHLQQVREVLRPGGLYIVGLDLHHPDVLPDEDVWRGARGRLQVQQVVQYLPPGQGERFEEVIMQLMVTRPRGTEHHGWSYRLRTYDEAQWSAVIDAAGWRRLEVCEASGHASPAGSPLPYQLDVLAPV